MSIPQALPASPIVVTREYLQSFVGKTVEDFCSNGVDGDKKGAGRFGRVGDSANHCAHFVGHALDFRIGKLCTWMSNAGRLNPGSGRSLVVSDIFNVCPIRGPWDEKPKTLTCCLIFAVGAKGVAKQGDQWIMSNIPRKHVGIFLSGECYNYHNTVNEGVAADGPEFFKRVYGAGTQAFYGTFPVV
jgi:hypothetical protein